MTARLDSTPGLALKGDKRAVRNVTVSIKSEHVIGCFPVFYLHRGHIKECTSSCKLIGKELTLTKEGSGLCLQLLQVISKPLECPG